MRQAARIRLRDLQFADPELQVVMSYPPRRDRPLY